MWIRLGQVSKRYATISQLYKLNSFRHLGAPNLSRRIVKKWQKSENPPPFQKHISLYIELINTLVFRWNGIGHTNHWRIPRSSKRRWRPPGPSRHFWRHFWRVFLNDTPGDCLKRWIRDDDDDDRVLPDEPTLESRPQAILRKIRKLATFQPHGAILENGVSTCSWFQRISL